MAWPPLDKKPIGAHARVTWTAPENDPDAIEQLGWCADHNLVDPLDEGTSFDPTRPPTPSAVFWMNTRENKQWIPIPELRGALLTPQMYHVGMRTGVGAAFDVMAPYIAGQRQRWVDYTVDEVHRASGPWALMQHKDWAILVGSYQPTTITPSTEGLVRTVVDEPANRAFAVSFNPSTQVTYNSIPVTGGLQIDWGVQSGRPQFSLWCPYHQDGENPYDQFWQLLEWRWKKVDGVWQHVSQYDPTQSDIRAYIKPMVTSAVDRHGMAWTTLQIIPTPQGLVIRNATTGASFVYNAPRPDPVDGVDQESDWRGWRAGRVGLRVFGCRGHVHYGRILFPSGVTMVGPYQSYDSDFHQDGYAKAILSTWDKWDPDNSEMVADTYVDPASSTARPGDTTHTYSILETNPADSEQTRINMTLKNDCDLDTIYLPPSVTGGALRMIQGRRTTPVIWRIAEVHPPVLKSAANYGQGAGMPNLGNAGAVDALTEVDLVSYVQELKVDLPDTGRGATASLLLRNFDDEADGGLIGTRVLDPRLKGIGKVTIDFAHILSVNGGEAVMDGPYLRVFTGYALARSPHYDKHLPYLELELGARSALWANGHYTLEWLPQPAKWGFREWMTLAFMQGGLREDQIHFGVDGSLPESQLIPDGPQGTTLGIEPNADFVPTVDRICKLAGYVWWEDRNGDVWFETLDYQKLRPATFTYDDTTKTDLDRFLLLPVSDKTDMLGTSNLLYVTGRDSSGRQVQALKKHTKSWRDPSSPFYVGRPLLLVQHSDDNPNPEKEASVYFYDSARRWRTIEWRTPGKDVWPGDVVVMAGGAGSISDVVGNGTVAPGSLHPQRFVVTSMRLSWTGKGEGRFWWPTYNGRLEVPLEAQV